MTRVLKSSKKDIITQAIASTISSSIYLRSFVNRFTILPIGTLLKKLERLAYNKLFINLSCTILPCFVEDTTITVARTRINTLLSITNKMKR